MRKHKSIFGVVPSSGSTGHTVVKKTTIVASADPDSLRHAISEEYAKAVQEHPDLEFGILVDPDTDDIRIDWRPRT